MNPSDHLEKFIDFNVAGRVLLLCRSKGVWEQKRVDVYNRAVKTAVLSVVASGDCSVTAVNDCLNQQLEFLSVALDHPPPPRLPKVEPVGDEPVDAIPEPIEAPSSTKKRRRLSNLRTETVDSMNMEEKLEEERKPLRKVLQEDCVRLGLLKSDRAKKLSAQMAGKERREAEQEIVDELRNNLHKQIRHFMRKNKGGPWDSPKLQEDLRLDISSTNSVTAVVSLTKHLLRERNDWEAKFKKGLLSNLLGGKLGLKSSKK